MSTELKGPKYTLLKEIPTEVGTLSIYQNHEAYNLVYDPEHVRYKDIVPAELLFGTDGKLYSGRVLGSQDGNGFRQAIDTIRFLLGKHREDIPREDLPVELNVVIDNFLEGEPSPDIFSSLSGGYNPQAIRHHILLIEILSCLDR